jgi:hypothetical protein
MPAFVVKWSQFLGTAPELPIRFQALSEFPRSLERGPLSLVITIQELLERENSLFGLESRGFGRRDRL